MVSQTKQVCYVLLDSAVILAEGYLRTLELKLSVFSWFQVFRLFCVLQADVSCGNATNSLGRRKSCPSRTSFDATTSI